MLLLLIKLHIALIVCLLEETKTNTMKVRHEKQMVEFCLLPYLTTVFI